MSGKGAGHHNPLGEAREQRAHRSVAARIIAGRAAPLPNRIGGGRVSQAGRGIQCRGARGDRVWHGSGARDTGRTLCGPTGCCCGAKSRPEGLPRTRQASVSPPGGGSTLASSGSSASGGIMRAPHRVRSGGPPRPRQMAPGGQQSCPLGAQGRPPPGGSPPPAKRSPGDLWGPFLSLRRGPWAQGERDAPHAAQRTALARLPRAGRAAPLPWGSGPAHSCPEASLKLMDPCHVITGCSGGRAVRGTPPAARGGAGAARQRCPGGAAKLPSFHLS